MKPLPVCVHYPGSGLISPALVPAMAPSKLSWAACAGRAAAGPRGCQRRARTRPDALVKLVNHQVRGLREVAVQKGEEGLQGPCLRSRVISLTEELGRGPALPRSDLCMRVLSCRLALEEGPEAAGGTRTVLWKCSWQWEGMDEPLTLHPALRHQPFHTLLCSPMLSPASPSPQPKEQQAVEEDAGGV